MNEIQMLGLRADLPIGFMAACGCLRICERTPSLQGARLRWIPFGGSYRPVLVTSASADEVVAALIADVKGAANRFALTWSKQIKSANPEEFVGAMRTAYKQRDFESLAWFSAFGNELCLARDGAIDSTPFDMSVAQQRFLADAVKLATELSRPKPDVEQSYREALFGPWLYRDDQHSLGWDPSTVKLGAFTHKAPTGMPNTGVRATVWLAFESLPLFPCFYSGTMRTRALSRARRRLHFQWPVWSCPLSLNAVSTILSWRSILIDKAPKEAAVAEFKARGITALYRSARYKPNKYLVSFRMPELLYSGEVTGWTSG